MALETGFYEKRTLVVDLTFQVSVYNATIVDCLEAFCYLASNDQNVRLIQFSSSALHLSSISIDLYIYILGVVVQELATYQCFHTAAWNVFTNDPKLSLYFHYVKNLIDVRRSCQLLENFSLVQELFDAFVSESCVGSDVHRIRVHYLDRKLLLGDFMNPISNILAKMYVRTSGGSRSSIATIGKILDHSGQ